MFKKRSLRRKIIGIVQDRFKNWKEKGEQLQTLLSKEELGEEVLLDIIKNENNPKVRKAAASAVAYFKDADHLVPELIKKIIVEPDWTVRFALARTCATLAKGKAVDLLVEDFKKHLAEVPNLDIEYDLKKVFADSLGAMGRPEAITVLAKLLQSVRFSQSPKAKELKLQILYSLGEVGDESAIDVLTPFSEDTTPINKPTQKSATHALNKVAQRLGFTSKVALLESLEEKEVEKK
jgi:HEAT repeat protein